jgi:excisionase family DNA binding protein
MEKRQYYSMKECSEILGIAYLTVFKLCERGELLSIKLGGRRLVPCYAVDAAPATLAENE